MKKTLKQVAETDLSYIDNVKDLRIEARRLELRIKAQEDALKQHLRSLPKEAVKAGLKGAVPAMAVGKLSGMALNAGTSLIANLISPKPKTSAASGLLSGSLKSAAVISLLKLGSRLLFGKKKK